MLSKLLLDPFLSRSISCTSAYERMTVDPRLMDIILFFKFGVKVGDDKFTSGSNVNTVIFVN